MNENEELENQFDDETFDAAAEFDDVEDEFDALNPAATVVLRDANGTAIRPWIDANPAEWAKIVASYVAGRCALRLGKCLKEKAVARLRQLKGTTPGATQTGTLYLENIRDMAPVVIGLNIHLLIHVLGVNQALLEVACPEEASPLAGRII